MNRAEEVKKEGPLPLFPTPMPGKRLLLNNYSYIQELFARQGRLRARKVATLPSPTG